MFQSCLISILDDRTSMHIVLFCSAPAGTILMCATVRKPCIPDMETLSGCLFSTCKTSAKQLSVSQYQQIHGRLTRCSKRNSHDLQIEGEYDII